MIFMFLIYPISAVLLRYVHAFDVCVVIFIYLCICILWYMHGIRHRRIFLKNVEKKFRCWTNITYTQLHHSHLYSLKLHHRQNLYRHTSFCHGIQTPCLDQHKLKTKKKRKRYYIDVFGDTNK